MRYIIAAATAFALIVGIAIGFALTATVFEAEAKPPPEVQPVEEQNLDGSGFIAVHEQGTANVAGTVDVGNLPAVQDVNVLSTPVQEGRLIELTIAPDGTSSPHSPFVDISDCSLITILARGGGIGTITNASPDGTTRVEVELSGVLTSGNVDGSFTSSMQNVQVALPFLQVRLGSASGGTAWIWCVP